MATFIGVPGPSVRWITALGVAGAILWPRDATAQVGVLDQTSPIPVGNNSASFNGDASSLTWQQQIKTGIGGVLEGLKITVNGPQGGTLTMRVRKGAVPTAQPVLFQGTVTHTQAADQSVFVDMTASGIALAVNELYVMEIQGNNAGLWLLGSYIAPPGQALYLPQLWLMPSSDYVGWRLGFMSYMVNPCTPGVECDDGDPCTNGDICDANNVCAGAPIVCMALDACHTVGTCDAQSGQCSNPVAPDATPCDDGDACTQNDGCQAGVCAGGLPVVCPAPDDCHEPSTCDPESGACPQTPKSDGTTCDDGDVCTKTDVCTAGVCAGMLLACPAPDACHEASTCDPVGGVCGANAQKPDGTPCPGGTCKQGACEGGTGGGTPGVGGGGGSSGEGGDGSGEATQKGGCGCRTAPEPEGSAGMLAIAGLGLVIARRRRRISSR